MHAYILYLKCENVIFAILCTRLIITTTLAGEWFNSLIFYVVLGDIEGDDTI